MSADGWQSALTGIGWDLGDPIPTAETDDALRARLLYVSGDSESRVRMIMSAKGAQLDTLAEEIGLRRRGNGGS